MDAEQARSDCQETLQTVSSCVVADQSFLEMVLTAILAKGHVLIEDVPGTGKTLTARSFASALGLSFSRIQFTPDLLPADITGTHIYREHSEEFTFTEGPIFANFVLADEINRAPPKTQAALLEAMAEGQVTVDGETHSLPTPFVVIATQNPVESEGVFPLPEAQKDRFLVKVEIGYPEATQEKELLEQRTRRNEQTPTADTTLDPETVRSLQQVPETVTVDEDIIGYIVEIARRTRTDARVEVGVSPRGTQRLLEAARAHAIIAGRQFVRPIDVTTVARPVLAHRIVLTTDATVSGRTADDILADVLNDISVPTVASEDGGVSSPAE